MRGCDHVVRGEAAVHGPELVGKYVFQSGPKGEFDRVAIPSAAGAEILLSPDGTARFEKVPYFDLRQSGKWISISETGRWKPSYINSGDYWVVEVDLETVGLRPVVHKHGTTYQLELSPDPDMRAPFVYAQEGH